MPHQCTNCGRTFADGSKEMLSGCPDCSGTKFQFRPDGFDGDVGAGGAAADGSDTGVGDEPDPAAVEDSFDSDSGDAFESDPGDAVSRTVGSAAATVRDLVGGSAGPDATTASPPTSDAADGSDDDPTGTDDGDDIIVAESEPLEESDAQADARTQFADPDEMPETGGFDPATDETDGEDSSPGSTSPEPSTESGSGVDTPSADPVASAEEPDGPVTDEGRTVAEEPDVERADRPDLAELREELNEQFESIRVVAPGQYELNLMELYDREEYIIALQEDGRYSIQMPETWREAEV